MVAVPGKMFPRHGVSVIFPRQGYFLAKMFLAKMFLGRDLRTKGFIANDVLIKGVYAKDVLATGFPRQGFPRQGVPLAKGFPAPRVSSPRVSPPRGSSPRGFLTKGFLTISGADVPSMGEEYVTMDNPSSCPEIPIKTNLMFSCHCGYLEWLHDGIILSNIHSRPPRARRRS